MQRRTLHDLSDARRDRRPVALITHLGNGEQHLYYPDGGNGDASISAELRALADQAVRHDRSQVYEAESGNLFVHVFNPSFRMIIVGAVHIAQALVPLASLCAYEVTVIDPRRSFATADRFPNVTVRTEWPDQALRELFPDARTAVVTLTHDPKLDDPALTAALKSDAFYIGALGSRKTQAARQRRLSEKGFTEEQQKRIHGPVGMDIGAQSPAEIAVSIMAQVTMARYCKGDSGSRNHETAGR